MNIKNCETFKNNKFLSITIIQKNKSYIKSKPWYPIKDIFVFSKAIIIGIHNYLKILDKGSELNLTNLNLNIVADSIRNWQKETKLQIKFIYKYENGHNTGKMTSINDKTFETILI